MNSEEKNIKELCALRPKTWSYLRDDGSENKRANETKKIIIVKRSLGHENYKHCLFNNTIILTSQQRCKSDHHEMYTEKVNRVALNSDDDEKLQTFDGTETYPYGTNPFIVCESEMLMVCKAKEKLKMQEEKFDMQITECKSEMYAKEKYEMFLKKVRGRCKREMRKYMKLKNINNDQF